MTSAELLDDAMAETARQMRERREPFAVATIIRAVGSTAAKPGTKALLDADGTILQGFVGGNCVRGALKQATARAMAEGQPQLISLHPQDILDEKGIEPGADVDGVRFARNGCPSEGSLDLFVEMVLPPPELVLFGQSQVAETLTELAERFDWSVVAGQADMAMDAPPAGALRMVVVATQGKNDLGSLRAALGLNAHLVAFVGSRRKFTALKDKLTADGLPDAALDAVSVPAGLPINAVTPDEIALSIMAQLTQERRRKRGGEEARHA